MNDAASDTRYMISDKPSAFDQVAADYDRAFTETQLARQLREIVWSRLAASFKPGDRVLELNCGTGEDATWLAQRGVYVVATDVSPEMLAVTARKAASRGVANRIETHTLDLASPLSQVLGEGAGVWVDGALSNFGGLNCVRDLHPLAEMLRDVVKPGGALILVPLSRWCASEMAWHLLHLQPRVAFRRLRREGVDARIGGDTVHVWYPSIGSIRRTFEPAFKLRRVTGLGVFLPPSYLEPVVAKRPRLFRLLARLEQATASHFPFTVIADHVILEFERVE